MNAPFDAKKFFNILDPEPYYKVVGLSIRVGIIVVIIFGVLWIKNLLFPQASTVKDINVHEGGTVIINKDKNWEIGAFGGLHNSGNEWFGGVGIRRRF